MPLLIISVSSVFILMCSDFCISRPIFGEQRKNLFHLCGFESNSWLKEAEKVCKLWIEGIIHVGPSAV